MTLILFLNKVMFTFVVLKENETIINKDKLSSKISGLLHSEINY